MDVYGAQLQESLRAAGVNHQYVCGTMEAATGIALIVVEASGQNQIIVVPGANDCLRPAAVIEALTALSGSHLLLQLETPLDTITAAAQHARANGMTVVLDPAPARALPIELLQAVNLLTPNESEALHLLGEAGDHIALADAPDIARRLRALGSQQVILKMGAQGAYWVDGVNALHCAAQPVKPLDTTAAGDCFNGALAVALAEGQPMEAALRFANMAAALSITRLGAQASLPTRGEVEAAYA
jgi:ribokinase